MKFLRNPSAVKEIRLGKCSNDLADQQIMRLHLEYLYDPAFQMAGTLLDQWRLDNPGGNRCQAALGELVPVPARSLAYKVGLFEQFFAGDVYDQLVILLYKLVRIPDMAFRVVDFPAPLEPKRAIMDSSGTSKEIPLTAAMTSLYTTSMLLTVNIKESPSLIRLL